MIFFLRVFGQIGHNWRYNLMTSRMQILSAKDAKYSFGRLIDLARAKPVVVTKHGRPVIVVLSVEEYERLKALESASAGEKDGSPGKTDKE